MKFNEKNKNFNFQVAIFHDEKYNIFEFDSKISKFSSWILTLQKLKFLILPKNIVKYSKILFHNMYFCYAIRSMKKVVVH